MTNVPASQIIGQIFSLTSLSFSYCSLVLKVTKFSHFSIETQFLCWHFLQDISLYQVYPKASYLQQLSFQTSFLTQCNLYILTSIHFLKVIHFLCCKSTKRNKFIRLLDEILIASIQGSTFHFHLQLELWILETMKCHNINSQNFIVAFCI